jgi:uncharacterized protein DUF3617
MLKPILVLSLVCVSNATFGQSLEPGEWEFNAVTSSPLFPGGQSTVFRRCITKEQADNPEGWMVRQNETADCKLTPGEKTPSSMKWEVFCPKANMRGTGIARLTSPGTVESELRMTSEFQGYRVQMNTRTTGRRLGPCKT